jgi:hypothetical protein
MKRDMIAENMQALRQRSGQAILISVVIIGSILLSVTTIAGYLSVQKVRTAVDVRNSARAIYAADAGVEYEFYKFTGHADPGVPQFDEGGTTLRTGTTPSGSGATMWAVGTNGKSSRALELKIE